MTRARWLCAAGAWVATGLTVASPATGASLSVRTGSDSATLTYRAAPGERNGVGIQAEYPPTAGVYLVWSRPRPALGPGCEPYSGNPSQAARCTLPPGLRHEASIRLGDRNDGATLEDAGALNARIAGGAGDDSLAGPGGTHPDGLPVWLWLALDPPQPRLRPATAAVPSVAGARIWGGSGADRLGGGLGKDVLQPGAGVDLVIGARGEDTVLSRDGEIDYIQCNSGRDRLRLDRWDMAWGRCGPIRRRGAPMVVPLNVLIDWEDLEETFITIGCPADMPTECRGVLTLSARGGPPIYRSGFRFLAGRIGAEVTSLDYDEMNAIVAREAELTLEAPDGAGRPRSISRVIWVEGEPPPD